MKLLNFIPFLLCCLLTINYALHPIDAARILAVYAFPGKSHFMMHTALIRELIASGHKVTMITAFTLEHQQLGKNYTEILIDPVYDFWHDVKVNFGAEHLFELTRMTNYDFLKMLEIIGLKTTEHALSQPRVQELINAKDTENIYDLLLAEQFYQEAFLAFAYKYKIPIVTSSTLGYENHMSQMMGFITPWSFVPHGFMPFTDKMTFMERLHNTYTSFYEDMDRLLNYFPKMDAITERYFGKVLGSNVQSKDMPKDKLNMFLKVFGSLKQRVLWKFEDENIIGLPNNVMIKKWLPQTDILAHRNTKVFVTHGGLFGTQEGVHYAVPMLGIPFYCDQHLNMNKAVQGGYAISLHFQSITEEILTQSLLQLMQNISYKENIQRISKVFRDRPVEHRKMAVYWIEHVIRHKGAKHLRLAGVDLPWYQFYLLDVIAFIFFIAFCSLCLIYWIIRIIVVTAKISKKVKSH